MRTKAGAAVLAALLLAAGCESSGGGGAGGDGGAAEPAGAGLPPARAGTGEAFSAGERATMEAAWRAFRKDSPGWPALREDWLALGPRATETLVENLFRAMILARLGNFPEGYDRARKELVLLVDRALPTLAGILSAPTWTDPRSRTKQMLPTEVVSEICELLVIAGPPSVPYLTDLTRSGHAGIRRAAAEALGRIGDPAARDPLLRLLRESADWIDRMTAARALGYMKRAPATPELVAALDDPDESVVLEAARALARLGARESVPALDRRRERARSEGDFRTAAACGAAAKALRGAR